MKKIIYIACLLFIICQAYANIRIIPLPPLSDFEKKYNNLSNDIDYRFEKYLKNKIFSFFDFEKTDEEIKKEFRNLEFERIQIWYDTKKNDLERSYREDFIPNLELPRTNIIRNFYWITFDYNKANSFYNASLIKIRNLKFIALEAPLKENRVQFFYTILDSNASLVVRLNPEIENGHKKCFPYWKDSIEDEKLIINKNYSKVINYIYTDYWQDGQGIDPKILLDLVLNAKKLYDPQNPIAVHCVAGCGRTGTFIAAFSLIDEIDDQINSGIIKIDVSIEKTVFILSLQRYYMVSSFEQYLTLYRLVSEYLKMKLK